MGAEPTTIMGELFDSIGFDGAGEETYNLLAEYAETSGEMSRLIRGDATLHGRCWKLGEGLEIWSILYEREADLYYADCRPGFRSRYVRDLQPWELIEYDEDGEAVVRGVMGGRQEVIFELQNLTEIDQRLFREPRLRVGLAGLAYGDVMAPRVESGREAACRFELAERVPELAEFACENDYVISGRVLAWRELRNPVTASPLVWAMVDAARVRLEVLLNRQALRGRLRVGAHLTAHIWLQGHVLDGPDVKARYEGVDWDFTTGDFWSLLRRDN